MNFFTAAAIINAVTSIIISFLIFARGYKEKKNITFSLFALAVGAWSVGYFFWMISTTPTEALMWSRVFMAIAIFIPFFYFHFVVSFLGENKNKKLLVRTGYFFAFVFVFINFTPFFISGVSSKLSFLFWPDAGPYYLPFLIIWFFYVIYGLYLLFKKFINSTGDKRSQILFILIGTMIGYIGGSTNYFLWFDIPIPPYGNILVSFYVVMVAYAVLKHRLFNIKVIATELLIFSLWIFMFARVLLSANQEEQLLNIIFLVGIIFIGYFLIQSVRKEVEQREKIEVLAEDLEKANVRLKELDERKSEFVSIASHQLRSPLTAMKGYASMLLEGSYGKFPEKAKDIVSRIFESTNLMTDSVEDFLDVSRIEQGRMKYNKTDFNIADLAKTVVDELTPTAEKKNLTLSLKTISTNLLMVNADLGKIKQVFSNLIDNSIKYTPKGSILVSVSENNGHILLMVKDTGVGISKETQSVLFDKFVRADNAHKVNVYGTGLGLYVAKQMIEAHGGKIWAESDGEGKGSSFFVELKAV